MAQPVTISEELLLDARLAAEIAKRTVDDQIELWAQLGRAIEPFLDEAKALELRRNGAAVPLSELLRTIQ
jgi:hypothetical protein